MDEYICYLCGCEGAAKEMAMVLGDVDAVCLECIEGEMAEEE